MCLTLIMFCLFVLSVLFHIIDRIRVEGELAKQDRYIQALERDLAVIRTLYSERCSYERRQN